MLNGAGDSPPYTIMVSGYLRNRSISVSLASRVRSQMPLGGIRDIARSAVTGIEAEGLACVHGVTGISVLCVRVESATRLAT